MKAGANSAVTQYFYNSDAYFRFVDEAYDLGVTQPVIAGIMPITNSSQLLRFSDACGAEIPRWIRLRLQSYGDDIASIRAFGEEVVTDLCDQLLTAGAPGLHFYSLNQADAVLAIADNLDLRKNT
jgi:methylenetetrahydrofolate reductase (NADPH)